MKNLDHYLENEPSLNWEKEYDICTQTLSIMKWKKLFLDSNFKDIQIKQFGRKGEWKGTLIISATK